MATSIKDKVTYAFVNWTNQKVIDDANHSSADGNPIILYQAHLDDGGHNQLWTANKTDDGYFYLTCDETGSNITVKSGSSLIVEAKDATDNAKWKFIYASSGQDSPSWCIQSKTGSVYITTPEGTDVNKTQLVVMDPGNAKPAWQRWVAYPIAA